MDILNGVEAVDIVNRVETVDTGNRGETVDTGNGGGNCQSDAKKKKKIRAKFIEHSHSM